MLVLKKTNNIGQTVARLNKIKTKKSHTHTNQCWNEKWNASEIKKIRDYYKNWKVMNLKNLKMDKFLKKI